MAESASLQTCSQKQQEDLCQASICAGKGRGLPTPKDGATHLTSGSTPCRLGTSRGWEE